jgi:hypothetical protein
MPAAYVTTDVPEDKDLETPLEVRVLCALCAVCPASCTPCAIFAAF